MEEIVAALAEQQDELDALLVGLDEDGWARPSACEGWSVSDVVLHLAQTNEMAIGSARDDYEAMLNGFVEGVQPHAGNVDDGAGLLVAAERGDPPSAVHERWARSCERPLRRPARPGAGRPAAVGGGRLAARIARHHPAGRDLDPHRRRRRRPRRHPRAADRLRHVARLAWRTIPYAFDRAGEPQPGPVAFELVAPSGADWTFGDAVGSHRDPRSGLRPLPSRQPAGPGRGHRPSRGEGPDGEDVLRLVRTLA